ncbi:hypothetical protein PALB_34720 [Pseudoalteromonas luteoviolacea B = ATCC 29581]|nr:hypothetical protein PALB_34720 [Pseudoalteromonas luteoviolacea B = ATCC 29581]
MSISPYQYRILTQSLAVVRPNFHCFCVSLRTQVSHFQLNNALITKTEYAYQQEDGLFRFIHQCVGLTLDHPALVHFISAQAKLLKSIEISERDICVICNCFLSTMQLHLGKQYTLAMRNAWRRLLHIIANILNHELHGRNNVVSLVEHKSKKTQAC